MNRVALVTGGSRGIGRAICLALAADGHQVAVNYTTRPDAAEVVVEEIESAGGRAIAVVGDVSSPDDVEAVFEKTTQTLGPVEVLVNNAGITRDGLGARMSVADWDRVIEVDLRSVFICTKAALRPMLRKRWGRIISIGSVGGLYGNPGQANYAAAKAGIIGFTKSIAKEVGSRGITANVVAPGFIATDMTAELGDEALAAAAATTSLGRLGTPEEIASMVSYLAGDNAGYVTGQVMVVDGGLGF